MSGEGGERGDVSGDRRERGDERNGRDPRDVQPCSRPRVVAHRGASFLAPENTLAAFRQAWALGCEAIELDVHLSADGHAVVIHDQSLQRTAGSPGLVQEHTLEELRGFEVGSWKHEAFTGERLATLREVIGAAPAGRTVFVEVKTPAAATPVIAEELRRLGREFPAVALGLQTFDLGVLTQLAAALPGVAAYWTIGAPRQGDGTITAYPPVVIDRARELGLAGIALDARGVRPALLEAAGAAGVLVDVWTINDAEALRAWLAQPAIRWVETDRPELVEAVES